jgi:inner membrane protein
MDPIASASRAFQRMRDSALFRVLGTSFLVLLLQIPVGIIAHTIDERRMTKDAAAADVTRTWGGSQELVGPILTVPSIERWLEGDKPRQRTVVRHFLPRVLSVRGRADTEVRRRGIFDVPLFAAQLRIEGSFVLPEPGQFAARAEDIQWQRASLSIGVADPKAIRACSPLSWGDRRAPFEPGPGDVGGLGSGLHVLLADPGRLGAVVPFSFDLTLGGSGRLAVVPAGDETVVALGSRWPDPSFDGAWLPVERRVGAQGFEATWRVLNLGRNFPSSWIGKEVDRGTLSASAFGVTLLSPVDTYRTNDRAVKYQLLFLGLTFLGFTLFELLAGLRVHPFQYLLVGLSLCLFYLLLLSLSEQIGFLLAYAIAAELVVALFTIYVRFVLGSWTRAIGLGAFLWVLYGFLYVLLQIQDYALLAGSLGLFVVLAAVMWFTRNVDWYRAGAAPERAGSGAPAS